MSKFLKEHKKNLKKLTRKQLIQQVLNWIEISSKLETQFNDTYEDLDNKYQVCESELIRTEWFLRSAESALHYKENLQEETQEALDRCRNLLASYKELSERLIRQDELLKK